MKKAVYLSLVVLFMLSSGCVSAAKYDLAMKDLEETSQERDSLNAKNDLLRKQMEAQAEEIEALKTKVEELSPKAEKAEQLEKASQTYEELISKLETEIQEGEIEITEMKNRLTMTMVDKILFSSGSAKIGKKGRKVLDKVVPILKQVTDRRIQVEGHTDNVPIVSKLKKRFPTNWELSTARATEVLRYLQEHGGIDPKILTAVGYAEYAPVAENTTEAGRRKNRRIEIVLLPMTQ